MTGNKAAGFPKKRIIPAVIAAAILAGIIIGGILYFHSQKAGREFDSAQAYHDYAEINEKALRIEENYAEDGFVPPEALHTVLDELELLAKEYRSKGLIASYDRQATGIYFKLNGGAGYLYTLTVKELLAGDDIGKILTIEPYAANFEFVGNYLLDGRSPDKSAQNIAQRLPEHYSFSKEDNWDSLSFEQVGKMGQHKIIIWYGHGGYVEEHGPVLGTSIPITDQDSVIKFDPMPDTSVPVTDEGASESIPQALQSGEIIYGKKCYCLTPRFFEKHIEDNSLKGSLVYLAACQSAHDNRLAEVFIKKGASLVVGSSQSIHIRYMLCMMDDFMSALAGQNPDGTYRTAEAALNEAKNRNGAKDSAIGSNCAEVRLIYPKNKSEYRLYGGSTSAEPANPIGLLIDYLENNVSYPTVLRLLLNLIAWILDKFIKLVVSLYHLLWEFYLSFRGAA